MNRDKILEAARAITAVAVLFGYFSMSPTAFAITKAKEQSIKELLAFNKASRTIEFADFVTDFMIMYVKTGGREFPKEAEYVLSKVVQEVARERLDDMDDQVIQLYDKYFTHNEIKQLLDFYRSPVGRKLERVAAPMNKEVFSVSFQWGVDLGGVVMEDIQASIAGYRDAVEESTMPAFLYRKKLEYPKSAIKKGIEGKIFVAVLIDEKGKPVKAKVLKRIPEEYTGFDAAGVDMVMQSTYSPSTVKGSPVKTWLTVPLVFSLE